MGNESCFWIVLMVKIAYSFPCYRTQTEAMHKTFCCYSNDSESSLPCPLLHLSSFRPKSAIFLVQENAIAERVRSPVQQMRLKMLRTAVTKTCGSPPIEYASARDLVDIFSRMILDILSRESDRLQDMHPAEFDDAIHNRLAAKAASGSVGNDEVAKQCLRFVGERFHYAARAAAAAALPQHARGD